MLDYGSSSGSFAVSSASGLLVKHEHTALGFACSDGGTAIYAGPEFSSTVTLTPVDQPQHGSSAPTIRTPVASGLTGR